MNFKSFTKDLSRAPSLETGLKQFTRTLWERSHHAAIPFSLLYMECYRLEWTSMTGWCLPFLYETKRIRLKCILHYADLYFIPYGVICTDVTFGCFTFFYFLVKCKCMANTKWTLILSMLAATVAVTDAGNVRLPSCWFRSPFSSSQSQGQKNRLIIFGWWMEMKTRFVGDTVKQYHGVKWYDNSI